MLLRRNFDFFFFFFTFRDRWRPITTHDKFEFEIPNARMRFFDACFRERGSAITQIKYCPKQDPRQSVTSSYHLNQSALRGSKDSTREKRDIPLWMLSVCKTFRGEYDASLSLCCSGLQQRVNSANWNLFAYAKEQLWIDQVEIIRSHSLLQLQPQGAVQDLLSSFLIRLLWADRTYRRSTETTDC